MIRGVIPCPVCRNGQVHYIGGEQLKCNACGNISTHSEIEADERAQELATRKRLGLSLEGWA
jgi:hypothetical protein